jgi:hypothetical protein
MVDPSSSGSQGVGSQQTEALLQLGGGSGFLGHWLGARGSIPSW